MGIGKHTDIITVMGRSGNIEDGYGGVVEVYSLKWIGYARLKKVSGNKAIEAGATALGSTYEIYFRKNPNVTFVKTDKILYENKTFGIVSIDDDDESRFITIIASVTT